jgi:membrane-bound ClpP family serine protease
MALIILLALAGLSLVFLEFFLPGAVLAVLGTLAILVSLGIFFVQYPLPWGILYLSVLLLAIFAVCKLALWRVRRSSKAGHFYLGEDQEGYAASSFDQSLIGKEGTVSTELKPAGHITVGGQLCQALSESGFISKGAAVQIVGGKGSHLIVTQRK